VKNTATDTDLSTFTDRVEQLARRLARVVFWPALLLLVYVSLPAAAEAIRAFARASVWAYAQWWWRLPIAMGTACWLNKIRELPVKKSS
jgi:hypothetical protein